MNQLKTSFDEILKHAVNLGIPNKPRAILREYLQTKFITTLYKQKLMHKISFVGGTSLRLLHKAPRFSEDLDFDNLGLNPMEVEKGFEQAVSEMSQNLGIKIELKNNVKGLRSYFEIRFPDILFDLNVSTNDKEKILIKLDFSTSWHEQKLAPKLFSHLGEFEVVVTNDLGVIMAQKLAAYVGRKQTQPRDLFDLMWLDAKGVKPDFEFLIANGRGDMWEQAIEKANEEKVTKTMIARLEPFMFDSREAAKILFLKDVINNNKWK